MNSAAMHFVARVHRKVFVRRTEVLANRIAPLVKGYTSLLDLGCGEGSIAALIALQTPGLTVRGIDVHLHPRARIPVDIYDGRRIPAADKSFDVVTIVDVLHHTDNVNAVLAEARRVARNAIVIKDHFAESPFDKKVLAFMDWVGNRAYGIQLPYNYMSREQWKLTWQNLDLTNVEMNEHLGLYPAWGRVFAKGLHFIVKLIHGKPSPIPGA